MNRTRYYTTVVPIAGILYVIALLTIKGHHVATVGALVLAGVAIAGAFFADPDPDSARDRDRKRDRDRT